MSQNLPVNGFKQIKKLSKFDENFIKNYDENSNKWYLFEESVKYPTKLFNLNKDLPFLPERKEIVSLFVPYITKKTMLFTKKLYNKH